MIATAVVATVVAVLVIGNTMKQVRAIESNYDVIIIGDVYDVLEEDETYYFIINRFGRKSLFYKWRFEVVNNEENT